MSQKNRKLGRTSDQRRAMLRAMVTYLLENGQIKTTVTRAKEVAPVAEKMITLAKDNTLASYRQALSYITKEDVANKLFKEIGPKYAERNGGYTRVVTSAPAAATPPRWRSSSWCDRHLQAPWHMPGGFCVDGGGKPGGRLRRGKAASPLFLTRAICYNRKKRAKGAPSYENH